MTWKIINPFLGMPAIDELALLDKTGYVKPPPLGTVVQAQHASYGMGEFIFLKGVQSTLPKSWVGYDPLDFGTNLLASNMRAPVAIAMATNSGSTAASYGGWYQRAGLAIGKAGQSFADNGNVYASATNGTVDDAVVAGDLVVNAKGAASETSALGYVFFELDRPYIEDRVGAVPGATAPVSAAPASISATQWGFASSTLAQATINAVTG